MVFSRPYHLEAVIVKPHTFQGSAPIYSNSIYNFCPPVQEALGSFSPKESRWEWGVQEEVHICLKLGFVGCIMAGSFFVCYDCLEWMVSSVSVHIVVKPSKDPDTASVFCSLTCLVQPEAVLACSCKGNCPVGRYPWPRPTLQPPLWHLLLNTALNRVFKETALLTFTHF